jgi:RNA polymerase sigma factor (sigma-70 family)
LDPTVFKELDNLIRLIEGCRNQDARCQKMLYEHFYGYLLKIAFRYVYHYETAVNVTNDGFVKIFQNINKFRPDEAEIPERLLMGWMKRIIINTAIDELRKNKKTPEMGEIPDYLWEQPDNSLSADRFLLYKELISHIKKLPPMYRIAFNMYTIDGCTHLEIANKLGISEGTSKSNLSRARVILQKMIKGNAKANPPHLSERNIVNPGEIAFDVCPN